MDIQEKIWKNETCDAGVHVCTRRSGEEVDKSCISFLRIRQLVRISFLLRIHQLVRITFLRIHPIVLTSFLCASISSYACIHHLRLDEVHTTFSDQRLVSITKPQEGFLCQMCLNSVFTQTTYNSG